MKPETFYANVGDRFGATFQRPNNPHRGDDFPWGAGTPIPAFTDMLYLETFYHSGLGHVAVAQTAEGALIGFCHLLQASAWKRGQVIRRGEIVGLVGNTGTLSQGNHLHLTASWSSSQPWTGAVFGAYDYVMTFLGGSTAIGTPATGGTTGDDMPLTEDDIFRIWTFRLANAQGVGGRAADWVVNASDAVGRTEAKVDAIVKAEGKIEGIVTRVEASVKGLTSQGFTEDQVKTVAAAIVSAIKVPTAAENGKAAREAIVK